MYKSRRPERPPGFSREYLEEHRRLYPATHQLKIKEIEARLLRTETASADPTYSPLRSLKKEHAYALNSVKLHAYFFGNIDSENKSEPSPELINMLERYFGSVQEWEKQFSALAMCSRGWVILGFDLVEGVLINLFSDDDSEGVWSVLPLLVLDINEHAYCNVFLSKSDYVDNFFKNVYWEAVNRRLNLARDVFKNIGKII